MSVLLNRKCCATCEHWMGKRESGKSVRCDNDRVLGQCVNKYEQWTGYKK